jgi:pimeloyl-ACP methyl ester carboxylesterase
MLPAMSEITDWERRFRAPILAFPAWAAERPDRLVLASTESGTYQLHAWDRAAGTRIQVTDHPVGVISGRPTLDGHGVAWFRDETGDETGAWVVTPFEGGEAVPLFPGLPAGWPEGLALGDRHAVAGISTPAGFGIYALAPDGSARRLAHHPQPLRLPMSARGNRGGLSADEALVCLEVMEDGDVLHPWLRVVSAMDGTPVAEIRDAGLELAAFGWSPIRGDNRIAVTHEREGEHRPAIWDPGTGALIDLPAELDGVVAPADWYPDASALLLQQLVEGRHHLHRLDLATGKLTLLDTEPGSMTAAAVRPDGAVWYRVQSGEQPGKLLAVGNPEPLIRPDADPPPAAQPFRAWSFRNPAGQRVHGFLAGPPGDGPHPVIMQVHGGPASLDTDRWAPEVQASIDAGFLVAMVNYRGSIGYGREWRDALIGNVGFPELEDVVAGLDDLVARGLADPARAVLAGRSWGGYITLLGAGRHPERWVATVAGVPVADYVAAYEDEAPILQALDRALLGGPPSEVPDLIRERSPITYAEAVRDPMLILAGLSDSRCPIRQVRNYVDLLWETGRHPEVYTYATGHSSFDIDEKVRQTAITLDFLARHVPGIRPIATAAAAAAQR